MESETCDVCKDYKYQAFDEPSVNMKPSDAWHNPGLSCILGFEADFDLNTWPVEEFRQFVQKIKEGKPACVHLTGVGGNTSWWPTTPTPVVHSNKALRYTVWEGNRAFGKSDEKVCPCLIARLDRIIDMVDQALNTLANRTTINNCDFA